MCSELRFWEGDLLHPTTLESELFSWHQYWAKQDANQLPSNLIDALRYCDLDIFPCIHRLLMIGCTLPVTSCEAERSFSALGRTVSYLRSSMSEERLAGLTLMHLHRDVA